MYSIFVFLVHFILSSEDESSRFQEKLGNGSCGTVYKISETQCVKVFSPEAQAHSVKNELEKNRLLATIEDSKPLALALGVPDFTKNELTMNIYAPMYRNHKILPDQFHELVATLLVLHEKEIALMDIKWENFLYSLSEDRVLFADHGGCKTHDEIREKFKWHGAGVRFMTSKHTQTPIYTTRDSINVSQNARIEDACTMAFWGLGITILRMHDKSLYKTVQELIDSVDVVPNRVGRLLQEFKAPKNPLWNDAFKLLKVRGDKRLKNAQKLSSARGDDNGTIYTLQS